MIYFRIYTDVNNAAMSPDPEKYTETRIEKLESGLSFSESDVNDAKFVYSPAEKRLVRKINWTVMPLVCSILFVQVNSFYFSREKVAKGWWYDDMVHAVHRQIHAEFLHCDGTI